MIYPPLRPVQSTVASCEKRAQAFFSIGTKRVNDASHALFYFTYIGNTSRQIGLAEKYRYFSATEISMEQWSGVEPASLGCSWSSVTDKSGLVLLIFSICSFISALRRFITSFLSETGRPPLGNDWIFRHPMTYNSLREERRCNP